MWHAAISKSSSWNIVERLLFPAPQNSYSEDSFPNELIFVPGIQREDPAVPCLFLPFRHARFLFIFFHGNAEDLGLCYTFCCVLREQFQVHVLAVEYPGYGICPGRTTEEGIFASAMAAFRFASVVLKWPLDGIKLLGRSLGSGPAVAVAAKYRVAGVILVAPFLSIQEVFRHKLGNLAGMIQDRFSNRDRVQSIRSPTLIIHGRRDNLVPCSHGETLYHSITSKKMMVSPVDMGHNTSLFADIGFFVLPMLQFFSLPDYTFEDITIPEWVFPLRIPSDSQDTDALVPDSEFQVTVEKAPSARAIPRAPVSASRLYDFGTPRSERCPVTESLEREDTNSLDMPSPEDLEASIAHFVEMWAADQDFAFACATPRGPKEQASSNPSTQLSAYTQPPLVEWKNGKRVDRL